MSLDMNAMLVRSRGARVPLCTTNILGLALRAALNVAQSPPKGFEQIVASFFASNGPKLVAQCEEAVSEPRASLTSEGFRKVLVKNVLPRLRERWGQKSQPN